MKNGAYEKRVYGILGRNIKYSLSPSMHNAAFEHFGIDAEYKLFDIEEKDLDVFFKSLASGRDISGINVTVPYKIKMMEKLKRDPRHSLDALVRLTGALNTIKVEGRTLTGFNTDVQGFYDSLVEDTGFAKKESTVFVLGAGGAGRAISIFLASLKNTGRVNVHDADREKLDELGDFVEGIGGPLGSKFCLVDTEEVRLKIRESDLVINATPLGTKNGDPLPVDPELLGTGTVVYDLVYARETELVRRAKGKGLVASGGLGMLVNQGALAFRIWNPEIFRDGEKGEEDFRRLKKIMKEAALSGLRG